MREVVATVYALRATARCCACCSVCLPGAYHTGVVVDGAEWAFGGGASGSGVYAVAPRSDPTGAEVVAEIELGTHCFSSDQLDELLRRLVAEERWQAASYDLRTNNCNHFADELCRLIVERGLPGWVNRLASLPKALHALVVGAPPRADAQQQPPQRAGPNVQALPNPWDMDARTYAEAIRRENRV